MAIKRIYYPYTLWEDYLNGMYDISKKNNEDELIKNSIELLSNSEYFFNVSLNVINEWKISSDINLSNSGQNRRSWIGQAACCYKNKCPEILTRVAWSMMTEQKQKQANLTAEKIIRIYENKSKRIHKGVGKQMLFEWDT